MVMYVQLQSGALVDAVRHHLRPTTLHGALTGAVGRAQQVNYHHRPIPIQIEESAPDVMVKGDSGCLRHALAELISNAVTFSEENSQVIVTQWVSEGTIWITISDRGVGIPEDELQNVFKPFYQVNRPKYEQQGIGIGLTLAKGIVEAHGGTLELQSRLGQGTLVTVALPAGD